MTTAPAAPLAQEEEPALVQEEQALPHEEPAPPPAAALVPDLPKLAAEQSAVSGVQDEPGIAMSAPLAFEPAAEPFSRAAEPDAVMLVGPSAPVTEEPALAASGEIAAAPAELTDFLLEPLPPPVTADAAGGCEHLTETSEPTYGPPT